MNKLLRRTFRRVHVLLRCYIQPLVMGVLAYWLLPLVKPIFYQPHRMV